MLFKKVSTLTLDVNDEMKEKIIDDCGWTIGEILEEYGTVDDFIQGWVEECLPFEIIDFCVHNGCLDQVTKEDELFWTD
jgi:hypothetical protein